MKLACTFRSMASIDTTGQPPKFDVWRFEYHLFPTPGMWIDCLHEYTLGIYQILSLSSPPPLPYYVCILPSN